MNRAEALRVLGVADDATHHEILAAFARLSAHLEARGSRASSADERRACLEQVATLRLALDLRSPLPAKPFDRRLGLGIAIAVAAVAAALTVGAWMESDEGAPTERAQAVVEPETVPPKPARVSVRANVPGAEARFSALDGRAVATAAADGTPVEIPTGEIRLAVSHPDCRSGFEQVARFSPGEDRALEVTICPTTGWLVVRSNQLGDAVRVDGVALGATGPRRHPVRPGRRAVAVSKPGFVDWSDTATVEPGQDVVVRARLARPPQPDPVVARDAGPGGSRGWHQAVASSMVQRYDLDLSGLIDTEEEVASVPCREWKDLERSYETGGLSIPMTRLYGFDGSRWVKDALGIDLRVREGSYTRMRECGLR